MRRVMICGAVLATTGCASGASYVHSDTTTLGRVVVYRNGVAYFERYAEVKDDKLTLAVPADKVDDFLKSLNVVDAQTGRPAPVSYPTQPDGASPGLINMTVRLGGGGTHRLKLSYVTDAPAWKPSYRVVLGDDKKVELVGWAIVDNTSGEDWRSVRLGVGSSSALSFRFDLRSIRTVEREALQNQDLFAQAPPTGDSIYGGAPEKKVLGDLGDDAIDEDDEPSVASAPAPVHSKPSASGGRASTPRAAPSSSPPSPPSSASAAESEGAGAVGVMARKLRGENGAVVIEGYAGPADEDKQAASLERANKLRERLVRGGVDPRRVVAVGKGEQQGRGAGVRVLEAPEPAPNAQAVASTAPSSAPVPLDPIGTSHFESDDAMTIARGTSAMVSILKTKTDGEVVYLYDPDGARGNAQFAFKSLRLRNPTDSQLESGPVTVFGDGRFVGEGLAEPIPARQVAFVPFALDRQIVVDRSDAERDEIAQVLTVQRGVFSTQVRHVRRATFVVHNRLSTPAIVYLRHVAAAGYQPAPGALEIEHAAGANLYRVLVDPVATKEVTIEESTPVYRTTDVRSAAGMELVRVYLSSAAMDPALKLHVDDLVRMQKDIGDDEQRVATLRLQMGEYRVRMDELHAQIVTLRAVRTAGPLMTSLEKKLQEMSDRLSRSTIDVVSLEEKLMLARIRFEDGVADLTLDGNQAPQEHVAAK